MKKILVLLLFACMAMVSCDEPRPTCVVVEKHTVYHRFSSDDYYVITKSIYNGEKKIASVTKDRYLLYNVGDTVPEPYSAHK